MGSLLRAAALCLLVGLAACQQAPDISGELEAYIYERNNATVEICDCPEEVGYATKADCDSALLLSLEQERCLGDALVGAEEPAQGYLDCVTVELIEYAGCLDGNPCGEGRFEACTTDYLNAVDACPQLPSDAAAAFSGCSP